MRADIEFIGLLPLLGTEFRDLSERFPQAVPEILTKEVVPA